MYNNDKNKIVRLARDTIYHKKIIMDICLKVSEYLVNRGETNKAIEVLKRACEHDNTKFNDIELEHLISIITDDSNNSFKNAQNKLSDREKKAIEVHWKNNRHHPEYFSSHNNMSEIDIIEMVCDWYARSIQYNTDFIPFIIERQKNRFKFNEEVFKQIMYWCYLVVQLYTVNVENIGNK